MSALFHEPHRQTLPYRNRADCQYEHVTTPRAGVFDGAEGQRRYTRRVVDRLLIGCECELPDGRIVVRESVNQYEVWSNDITLEKRVKGKRAVLDYLIGEEAPPEVVTTKRTSKYHNVYYIKRERLWKAEAWVNGKRFNLGCRKSEEAAARLYDAFVIERGLDRPLNFPQEQADGIAA